MQSEWEEGFAAGRHDVLRQLPDRDELARALYESSEHYDDYPWELLIGPGNASPEVRLREGIYKQADALLERFEMYGYDE